MSGGDDLLVMPCSKDPVSMWNNPSFWVYAFPALYPKGWGMPKSDGFRGITMKKYAAHVLRFKTPVFRRHHSFPFIIENNIHRTAVVSTFRHLYVSPHFTEVARELDAITSADLRTCAAHYERCRQLGQPVSLGNTCAAGVILSFVFDMYLSM